MLMDFLSPFILILQVRCLFGGGGEGVKKFRDSHKALAMAYVYEGRSVADVCAELSVSKSTLHGWLAEAKKMKELEASILKARTEADRLEDAGEAMRQLGTLPSEVQPLLIAVEVLLKEIKRLSLTTSAGRQ